MKKKHVFNFLILVSLTFLYTIITEYINNPITSNSFKSYFWVQSLHLFVDTILVITPLCILFKKLNFSLDDFIKSFIVIAVIQSLFTMSFLFIPNFKNYIFNNIIDLDYYFSGDNESIDKLTYFRLNGLASELTFAMALFQGFVLILIFNYYNFFKKKYLFYAPIIVISILFNARVGLFIFVSFFVFLLLENIIKLKLSRLLINAFNIVFFMFFLFIFISTYFPNFYQLFSIFLFSGLNEGNVLPHQDLLFGDHLFFPKNIFGLLFGEGKYVFSNNYESLHSDIGYVNIVMFGGLFLQVILIINYLYPLFILRKMSQFYNFLFIQIFFAILLIQFKGNVFYLNGFTKALILFGFYLKNLNQEKNQLINE